MPRSTTPRGGRSRLVASSSALLMGGSLFGFIVSGSTSLVGADTTGTTTHVSAAISESAEQPAISGDARYSVVTVRGASQGIWLIDQQTGTTKQVYSGNAQNPSVSPDGRYVAYAVYNSSRPVYLLDTQTGKSTLVSVSSSGVAADAQSDQPSVSQNGRYVVFQSMATNLTTATSTASGNGNRTQVYLHDMKTGETSLVSATPSGSLGTGNSVFPRITPDGRYVVFQSAATDLTGSSTTSAAAQGGGGGGSSGGSEGETTSLTQVFVRDLSNGTTTLASVNSTGTAGNASSAADFAPTISDNGQWVAFGSTATNLVSGDTNAAEDAFVHNMGTGATTRVSLDATGGQGTPGALPDGVTDTTATYPVGADVQISGDGTHVAFESGAALTPDDTNGVMDVYEATVSTGAVERMSVPAAGGTEATGTRVDGNTGATVPVVNGANPAISTDGRYVQFVSNGNLTADRAVSTETTETTETTDTTDTTDTTTTTTTETTSGESQVYQRTINAPTVTGVTPSSIGRGRSGQSLTVTGTNFTPPSAPGDTVVSLGSGTKVTSVTWLSSTSLQVTTDVAYNTSTGKRDVSVKNPANDSTKLASGFDVTARGGGYRIATANGSVSGHGYSQSRGDVSGVKLNQPVVGIANTATGNGYWLTAADGGIFTYGDAGFYGSLGDVHLNQPIVGMAATPDGHGYWLVASDGGVFAFGDAGFYGSLGDVHLNQPIVGMAATPDGHGYRLVASDGGVFAFGNAGFSGSLGNVHLFAPITGIAASPDGNGYWLVGRDGGVFTFGTNQYYGSLGGHSGTPVVGISAVADGEGYWLLDANGSVYAYGRAGYHGNHSVTGATGSAVGIASD